MTTERKKASNRKNAQKSTGPRSLSGKTMVSQNALKHGLLSRHLIVEGESQEEFSELLHLLDDEFQPIGLVEQTLVERIGISIWRQRRLVRAESAEISINRQCLKTEQILEVRSILSAANDIHIIAGALMDEPEETDMRYLRNQKKLWQSFLDQKIDQRKDPFSHLSESMQRKILKIYQVDAKNIDWAIQTDYGSWESMFEAKVQQYTFLIRYPNVYRVRKLVMQSQALPTQTDLLARYQTALDNDLYKAIKVLHEVQVWRQARALITVEPSQTDVDTVQRLRRRDKTTNLITKASKTIE